MASAYTLEQHNVAVETIKQRVRDFHSRKIPFRVYHGATNATRTIDHQVDRVVDTSTLNHVLSFDHERKTCIVQPNVPMDDFVDATLPQGLFPPVVPEFPGITVGGAFSGTGGESSSFKYGFFDRSVNWVDIVLADGELVRASKEKNPDLYNAAVGACGTFGVTVLFEVQLIPATTFVETTYVPTSDPPNAIATIQAAVDSNEYDFIDGIQFSSTLGVIVLGKFSNATPTSSTPVQRFTRAFDQWFVLHSEAKARSTLAFWDSSKGLSDSVPSSSDKSDINVAELAAKSAKDLVPVRDYVFRYDRGAFWMGLYAFSMFWWMPFNRFTRFLLDPLLRTRKMYEALHHSGNHQTFIVQDLALPASRCAGFVDWVTDNMPTYPLWYCPLRADATALMHRTKQSADLLRAAEAAGPSTDEGARLTAVANELLINVGVWAPGRKVARPGESLGRQEMRRRNFTPADLAKFVEDNRALEAAVYTRGGTKWLYAATFYTEAEFWSHYDAERYHEMRRKWRAEGLPSMWDKVRPREGFKEGDGEFWSIVKAAMGKDHLLGGQGLLQRDLLGLNALKRKKLQ
ncbi:hypothetical protein FH972_025214 [Carpinus fangiana]|uniref:Delta(24)-sterol reductase n=1 Tax=Carpinus fangiana TaxID=176857 RepID=A0A5N6L1B5_9ROSI|nr:hypothetical protein FH972_025214 [Carpinus fangiana]